MPQPPFIQKIDGSNAATASLVLTPGSATTSGNDIFVGVILTASGAQTPAVVGGILDSAGVSSPGVPVNNWISLGNSNDAGIRMEWWVCKAAASITSLTIDLTYLNAIIAVMGEYNEANGISNPVFQALQSNQNTIGSQYIIETAATYPNSGAALMLGLFAALGDSFNATPPSPSSSLQTVRSTGSLSIPPALSYQLIEQGNTATVGSFNESGEEVVLAVGALNITAESATELATSVNVAESTMQCLYLVISGGLILNTQPGFNDQPDSALVAGNYAMGLQMAKISGNAALGMCRMEFFQDIYTNGETVDLPISPVDGYQYAMDELTFVWGVWSTANDSNGWITGPQALWYCAWDVDQETGLVSCTEWYRADGAAGVSNDGHLQVFTIAQRQKQVLTAAATPGWTQLQVSTFVEDLAYSQSLLQSMNDDAKFAVLGQEAIYMGPFFNGETVPRPVSPADDYEYAYSEVTFLFSWLYTTYNADAEMVQLACPPYYTLASLNAAINPSTGVVTCAVGMMGQGGEGYTSYNTLGVISVVALCQRARTGTPAVVADQFAEIPNSLFYPGNDLPAGIGAQLWNNIQEAALTPEYFGPTLYALGATIPTPTSPIDGYAYQRSELTYLWEWGEMTPGPWAPSGGSNNRTALFSAQIDQATGVITNTTTVVGPTTEYTSLIVRLAPGGPYYYDTSYGHISVVVVGCRSAQQTELSGAGVTPPSDGGSAVVDGLAPGAITVNGV